MFTCWASGRAAKGTKRGPTDIRKATGIRMNCIPRNILPQVLLIVVLRLPQETRVGPPDGGYLSKYEIQTRMLSEQTQ